MTRADLARLVDEAEDTELPEIVGELEAAKARAYARLMTTRVHAPAQDALLTMDEVAAQLRMGETIVREMGRRGEIPTVQVGDRGVRVRQSALNEYIRKHERGATMPRGR